METRCKDIRQALHLAGVGRVGIAVRDAVDDQLFACTAAVELQQQRLRDVTGDIILQGKQRVLIEGNLECRCGRQGHVHDVDLEGERDGR